MKKILFLMFVIMSMNIKHCQAQADTTWIEAMVKLEVYQYMSRIDYLDTVRHTSNDVIDFFQGDLQLHFLESNLPSQYIFVKIFTRDILQCSNLWRYAIKDQKVYGSDNYFVLGINRNHLIIYHLYSFLNNDFEHLVDDLQASYLRYGELPLIKRDKQFVKKFYIEGLDLECLYQASKANIKDPDKYPCLEHGIRTIIVH